MPRISPSAPGSWPATGATLRCRAYVELLAAFAEQHAEETAAQRLARLEQSPLAHA